MLKTLKVACVETLAHVNALEGASRTALGVVHGHVLGMHPEPHLKLCIKICLEVHQELHLELCM